MDSSTSTVATDVRSSGHEEEEEGKNGVLMEELVLEILARLPIKSLMRFKSVSKHWYSIITSPIFIRIRRRRLPRTFVSLWHSRIGDDLPTRRKDIFSFPLSFEFGQDLPEQDLMLTMPKEQELGGGIGMVGCSNGVVCVSLSNHPQIYVLWNPATKHHRQFGGGKGLGYVEEDGSIEDSSRYGSGFCFDPFNNCFKVVQYKLEAEGTTATRVQVNVLSTSTNTWTGKDTEFLPYRIEFRIHNSTPTTCVDRWIHWVAPMFDPDAQLGGEMYLLSYDMISESFQRIKLPSCCSTTLYYRLAPYKHSLAVFVHKQTGPLNPFMTSFKEVDVWVLNDCGCANQSWAKLFTCRPSVEIHSAAGFFNKDLVLLVSAQNCTHLYDPVSGETNKLEKRGPLALSAAFPYSESIEPLN